MAVEAKEEKIEKARAAMIKIVQAVSEEITPQTVQKLLFNRYGKLYSKFPSKKVRAWAERKAEKWGLIGTMPQIYNVFYAVMRSIYKELEFDAGRNINIGWMYTTAWDIRDSVRAVIEKKIGEEIIFIEDKELQKELYRIVEKTAKLLYRYAREITERFTKGISLGALAWYKTMGLDRGAKLGLMRWSAEKGFKVVEEARSFTKEDNDAWLDK